MLHTLELHDFAIVDRLELTLSPGLNVLTGETGAGKSIVVDALQLLTGARADSGMIRSGSQASLVQATFQPESADSGTVESAGRRLAQNGRHSARVNGELVTVSELEERVGNLVVVFAQHAAQELQSSAAQRRQLDRLLAPQERQDLEAFRSGFDRLVTLTKRLEALREADRERSRKVDALNYQINDIGSVNVQLQEHMELLDELSALQHAEHVMQGGAAAFSALSHDEPSAVALTAAALRELQDAGRYSAQLAALAVDLKDALAAISAVSTEVEAFVADFEANPARLDAVQARLAKLEALMRKYGPTLADVVAFKERAEAELAELEGADEEIHSLERQLDEQEEQLQRLAKGLTAARTRAAAQLATSVQPLIRQLGMPKARFEAEVTLSSRRHRNGQDDVTFMFSANAGERMLPLADVASGGELSRLMLALNLVTGSDVPTLAFDEVDAGVGGATANHIAVMLGRLAQKHQVLVVTHLAQVAAHATSHFVVEKGDEGDRTVTRVRQVEQQDRPIELARMLSGKVTEASLEHARELLVAARGSVSST